MKSSEQSRASVGQQPVSARRRWATLALVVGSLCIALLIAEVLVRLVLADQVVLFPRHHVAAEYGEFTLRRLRPNATFWHRSVDGRWKFQTNSQGFRDERDFDYAKKDGVIRVLSIGDSHTQGFEVRQQHTYSVIAEKCLRARNIQAEVINTGISGFGTAEELVFLENEGTRYKPDFVLLGFYANDFRDNIKAGLYGLENGELVVRKYRYTPGLRVLAVHNEIALLRWLSENSYLYSLSLNTAWELAKQILHRQSVTEYAIPIESAGNLEQELTSALLHRMREVAHKNKIGLIVLDIPGLPESGRITSSVPPEMVDVLIENSDAFLSSDKVLGNTADVSKLHVPHGHQHISEYTHRAFGAAAAAQISALLSPSGADIRQPADLPQECRPLAS